MRLLYVYMCFYAIVIFNYSDINRGLEVNIKFISNLRIMCNPTSVTNE